MSNILIGVTGGIAVYKAASVVSVLESIGHEVKVIMTESATKFVTPVTFSALSHNPVHLDDFTNDGHIWHIELAEWASLFAIVPATYNTIMKIAQGIADNLLTSTVIPYVGAYEETRKPLLIFPAMNTNMYWNLEARGLGSASFGLKDGTFVAPVAEGKMACGTTGPGKLVSTGHIIECIERVLREGI